VWSKSHHKRKELLEDGKMARLSRTSLVAQSTGEDNYDPEVRQYIEDLGQMEEVPSGVSAINEMVQAVLSGAAPRETKLAVDQLMFDVLKLTKENHDLNEGHGDSMEETIRDHEKDQARFDREIRAKNLEISDQATKMEIIRQELAQAKNDYDRLQRQRVVSEAPSMGSTITGNGHIKKFKGEAFDGKAEHLEQFKNAVRMDIRLYPSSFPSEAVKVAYTISGLGTKPSAWVQQFHRKDPEGVLDSFDQFMKKLDKHFGDPNFMANQRTKLISLKQKSGEDITDHVTTFEVLCADSDWPEGTRATLFRESLIPALASRLRVSEVDQDDYEALRQKAIIYDREFQDNKKRTRIGGTTTTPTNATGGSRSQGVQGSASNSKVDFTKGHPGRRLNPEELEACRKEGRCFRCLEKGHLAPNCPKPSTRPSGAPANVKGAAAVQTKGDQDQGNESSQ
jgi:hypothetical protein